MPVFFLLTCLIMATALLAGLVLFVTWLAGGLGQPQERRMQALGRWISQRKVRYPLLLLLVASLVAASVVTVRAFSVPSYSAIERLPSESYLAQMLGVEESGPNGGYGVPHESSEKMGYTFDLGQASRVSISAADYSNRLFGYLSYKANSPSWNHWYWDEVDPGGGQPASKPDNVTVSGFQCRERVCNTWVAWVRVGRGLWAIELTDLDGRSLESAWRVLKPIVALRDR